MGRVQQPFVAVLEAAVNHLVDDSSMRNVWDRGNQIAVWLNETLDFHEEIVGFSQVLKDVGAYDNIESLVADGCTKVGSFEVRDMDRPTICAGFFCTVRIDLDTNNITGEFFFKYPRLGARTAANLQH